MEEEITDDNGDFERTIEDEALTNVFSQIKPYCLDLLDLLQNPNKKNSKSLLEMADFIRRAPTNGLQACLDYTLFPLLLLLDAAVYCRSPQRTDSQGNFGTVNTPPMPSKISDSVAEALLLCLEEVLKKCDLGSVNQMVVVMKKLTSGALLSPSEASEEFREGIIRCLKAMLLRLHPCSDRSCICKMNSGLLTPISNSNCQAKIINSLKHHSEQEECLLAFLRSQNFSAAVGHWLSLLLKTAETEAARGHRGSAKLRTEAFITLRVLIAKVGTADALAFFLPGVVSHFAKILHAAKNMISGAAGRVESIDQAVRGFTEFLMIVLGDEANLDGLGMSINDVTGCPSKDIKFFMEALRHLPAVTEDQGESSIEKSIGKTICTVTSNFDHKEKSTDSCGNTTSLYVNRTKDWIDETSAHVDKVLRTTFPHLCIHPAKKVRKGLVDGIQGLLSKCSYTLKKSKLMLLECLCVLVCDDSEAVAVAAQEFLGCIFKQGEKYLVEYEVAEIFSSLVEKLPRAVLGSEETVAVSHAQRLLAVMYYAGPHLVVDHLLRSPITAAHFLDVLALCLSHNSVFSGSVEKFILAKPFSAGYLHSIAELKAGTRLSRFNPVIVDVAPPLVSEHSGYRDRDLQNPQEIVHNDYQLPRMPPWFIHVGSPKLYHFLAGILRLVGLSIMADPRGEVSLSVLTEIPLDDFRKLISELWMKEYSKESWHSWYSRSGSGQLLRKASTAACILNEIIYGVSDQSIDMYAQMFQKPGTKVEETRGKEAGNADDRPDQLENTIINGSVWKVYKGKDASNHVIDCVGSILHEYLSPEVWNLPKDQKSYLLAQDTEAEDLNLHFFQDTTMLHQVIIDGIGIFNISLGKGFLWSGFLHSSLYLLLENLICSSHQIRSASDAVLRVLSASSGHPTVGHLVVANADYIIDSLCRQLRHLDLNPHVPYVLAAMLSYVGVAREILPLLEEPIRSVSSELEVLGRHQHPNLTIPFLKAVNEIVKSSRHEAQVVTHQMDSYYVIVNSKVCNMERVSKNQAQSSTFYDNDNSVLDPQASEKANINSSDVDLLLEHWEEMILKVNELKRFRRMVGSIAGSCIIAATPLLASVKEMACLVALDIVEDATVTLAKVEEAYRLEKGTVEAIGRAIELCSNHDLEDTQDTTDEPDENRLLPAMNKIWPFLVHCLQHKNPVAVRKCLGVVSSVVQICGGDFFSRRFHTDGRQFWKLLNTSQSWKKPTLKDGKPLLLPYRSTSSASSEHSMAESSSIKVQAAALNMIAEISKNKKSSSALGVVLKKVSGLVVGIACSGVSGLGDASLNALSGLSCIDPDLIWLLLADVYYTLKKDFPSPPASDFAEVSQLLPPALSSKEYLYIQYGGENFGFNVDLASTELVFRKMQSEVFTLQMYS